MKEDIIQDIEALPDVIAVDLQKYIARVIDKSAVLYRIFSRKKSPSSVRSKLEKKRAKYLAEGKKMQDLFGVRIALYFSDDIPIICQLIDDNFHVDNISKTTIKDDVFSPEILNYVCKLPDEVKRYIDDDFWGKYLVDDTFEIQIRTVFSEGWHEIEHDLRYKCSSDWEEEHEMNRTLNGIFATLETCDWSIISLFDQLAYKKYKQKQWEAMLRNKLRMRFQPEPIKDEINAIMEEDHLLAKELLKIDRKALIQTIARKEFSIIPKNYNNVIFIANALFIKNPKMIAITPSLLLEKCEKTPNT